METGQVKFLGKEQLLRRLRQKGYENIADVLVDKDVDSTKLLSPRFEFEIIQWRLSPSQKKKLSEFVRDLRDHPRLVFDFETKTTTTKRPQTVAFVKKPEIRAKPQLPVRRNLVVPVAPVAPNLPRRNEAQLQVQSQLGMMLLDKKNTVPLRKKPVAFEPVGSCGHLETFTGAMEEATFSSFQVSRTDSVGSYITNDDIPQPPPPPKSLFNRKTNNFTITVVNHHGTVASEKKHEEDFNSLRCKNLNVPAPSPVAGRKPLALPREIEDDEDKEHTYEEAPTKVDYLDLDAKAPKEEPEAQAPPEEAEGEICLNNRIYENVDETTNSGKKSKGGFLSRFALCKGKPKPEEEVSKNENGTKIENGKGLSSSSYYKRPLPSPPVENLEKVEDGNNTDYEDVESDIQQEYSNLPAPSKQKAKFTDLVTQLAMELNERSLKLEQNMNVSPHAGESKRGSTPLSSEEFNTTDEDESPDYKNIEEVAAENATGFVPRSYEVYKPPGLWHKTEEAKLEQAASLNDDDDDEEEIYFQPSKFDIFHNLYFRDTNRRGARNYLQNLDDGAFLFRNSKKYFLGLTVKHRGTFYDLGIKKKPNNKLQLDSAEESGSPEFINLRTFVEHFMKETIMFEANGKFVEFRLRPVPLPKVA